MLQPNHTVLVAVSGGPDSVALFHILKEGSLQFGLNLQVEIVHVNHQLRGDESEREERLVRDLGADWHVPVWVKRVDVEQYQQKSGKGLQDAARDLRYQAFIEVAQQRDAASIALAHHADDQAETVMMRLIRGTGTNGLAGMPATRFEKKVKLIRPLLRITKKQLLQYCHEQGLPFTEDSSNRSRKYTRNRLRLDVMPLFEQFNPKYTEAILRLTKMVQQDESYMAEQTEKLFKRCVKQSDGGYKMEQNDWLSAPPALQRRLIKLVLSYLSQEYDVEIDYDLIERLCHAASRQDRASFQIQITSHISMFKQYGQLYWGECGSTASNGYCYEVHTFPFQLTLVTNPDLTISFTEASCEQYFEQRSNDPAIYSAYFNIDELKLPLTVRTRRTGDRMKVLGLNGSKKVKNMLIDAKIPPRMRNQIPLITDAEGKILWIPGVRRSAHALVRPETGRLLHIKMPAFIHWS